MKYVITKEGLIINSHGRILSSYINGGYCIVKLNGKHFRVHRLVAEAYLPNPENKPQVNHKDGNKLNNNVENLEWCTQIENSDHARKNNLTNIGWGYINSQQREEILNKYNTGEYTQRQLAKEYGVGKTTIGKIIHNTIKRFH